MEITGIGASSVTLSKCLSFASPNPISNPDTVVAQSPKQGQMKCKKHVSFDNTCPGLRHLSKYTANINGS